MRTPVFPKHRSAPMLKRSCVPGWYGDNTALTTLLEQSSARRRQYMCSIESCCLVATYFQSNIQSLIKLAKIDWMKSEYLHLGARIFRPFTHQRNVHASGRSAESVAAARISLESCFARRKIGAIEHRSNLFIGANQASIRA